MGGSLSDSLIRAGPLAGTSHSALLNKEVVTSINHYRAHGKKLSKEDNPFKGAAQD